MRKREGQMKVKNLGKRGWHKCAKTGERNVQVNLLNEDKKGLQVNLSINKKKMVMNLWNADKGDWQSNISIRKKKTANESVGCREKRLANKRQYQKEKNCK